MINCHFKPKKYYLFYWAIVASVLMPLGSIPVRLAIALHQAPSPAAILTLGGDPVRETFAIDFARKHPALDIWLSSPYLKVFNFPDAGISRARVHIDRRAVDTVTNFTSLVQDFKSRRIQHVYLITCAFHMPRAKAIATFVLGSQGIAFTPISVPSDKPSESWWHVLRDIGRAIFWLFTGRTGASLNPEI